MPKVIKVENLSKAYQLGDFGTGTISRDLERFWAKMRGKEDPFLKIGEVNDRTKKGESDIVWSLKDLNFEIEQGDAVGIIGRNGAGKSTLLKILSRVTSPTSGSVKIKGRIASLLEVGTGFHPELSGRENIYLNGAILGMRKSEIKRKFDEIVDFAGVERYIDTPVKRYSSGMYVRLAFGVAAHLESEILVVDEVLSVGDAEFQKKCLGKMEDISKGEGRTVLFVSHNMGAIEVFCSRILLMHQGRITHDSRNVVSSIKQYLNGVKNEGNIKWKNDGNSYLNDYFIPDELFLMVDNQPSDSIFNRIENVKLCINGDVKQINPLLQIGIAVYDYNDNLIFWSFNTDNIVGELEPLPMGKTQLSLDLPIKLLNEGTYTIALGVSLFQIEWICEPNQSAPLLKLEIHGGYITSPYWTARRPGIIAPLLTWTHK
ncbi:MAG: transporter ATP-binding protein [Mucilaginibacter sp.]|nr:transporter ATP-binding protein [Mucilaginibacter sp.]